MKGITLCADCAYYDLKKHKCNRGATVDPDMSKGQDVRFYVDCPLPDVQEVRHGRWIYRSDDAASCYCSECNEEALTAPYERNCIESDFCPCCGAKMDADHIDDDSKKVGGAGNG